MELVAKRERYDCVLASLANCVQMSYDDTKELLSKTIALEGCNIDLDGGISMRLVKLALRELKLPVGYAGEGEYRTALSITKGYRGMYLLQSNIDKTSGHAVYCDGYRIYEVERGGYWVSSIPKYLSDYNMSPLGYYRFETPLHQRVKAYIKGTVSEFSRYIDSHINRVRKSICSR